MISEPDSNPKPEPDRQGQDGGPAESSEQERIDRRSLAGELARGMFVAAGLVTGVVAAATSAVIVTVGLIAYAFEPMFQKKQNGWADAGEIGQFDVNRTTVVNLLNPVRRPWDGAAGKIPVYVRRLAQQNFLVLNVNCTHLGCPVSWFPQSGLFMCPCHGGIYHEDGTRAAGPPPRGLYHLKYRIVDGHLHILVGHFPTLQEADTASYEPEERFHYHP